MHVLFESHGLNEAGESETYQAYRIVHAATAYADVSVVLPERWTGMVPSLEAAGATVIPVPYDNRVFPGNRSMEYMYWLYSHRARRACRDVLDNVDVIHRLNPYAVRYASDFAFCRQPFMVGPLGWSMLPPAWARRPAGAARNALKSWDRARIRVPMTRLARTYRRADAITLTSRAALGAFPISLQSRCTLTEEWVDTERYVYTDAPSDDEPVILYVGRLMRHKGIEYLLRALSQLRNRRWRLRLVGDGPLEASLRRECVGLDIASRVDFIGRVPRTEVAQHYRDAAVCCSPGLNESSGNVILEAMASGRPVIVAAWAGPKHIATSDCGVAVDVKTPSVFVSGLQDALRVLLDHPELRLSMGLAGRRRAEEVYDVRVILSRFRALHERLGQVL